MGGFIFEFILSLALISEKSVAKKTIIGNCLCVFKGPTGDKQLSLNKTSNFHFEGLVKEFLRGVSVTS